MTPFAAELVLATQYLAQPGGPDPTTGRGDEWGKAAPIGLLVIVLLCVAGYFLARSMAKQIKKVPAEFPDTASTSTGVERGDDSRR